MRDNLVDVDPRFATPDRLDNDRSPRAVDFALRPDSPAWKSGFEKLPLERIGLYQDDFRASWLVEEDKSASKHQETTQ